MSRLLVAIQFVLILLLALPFPAALVASPFALLTLIAGVLFGVWTLFFNRIGNFNIRPEPKAGSQLIMTGPYRYIRHPMYTAVLLLMAAFVIVGDDPTRIIYWLLLLTVLWIKSSIEEKMLQRQFAEYAYYMQTTGRFLPKLFRSAK